MHRPRREKGEFQIRQGRHFYIDCTILEQGRDPEASLPLFLMAVKVKVILRQHILFLNLSLFPLLHISDIVTRTECLRSLYMNMYESHATRIELLEKNY
jgi:hypothetical protein